MGRSIGELELKVLREVCRVISQGLDLKHALEVILGALSVFPAMKRATIILKDEGIHLSLPCNSHGSRDNAERAEISHDEARFIERILRNTRPFVLSDMQKEPLPLGSAKVCALNKASIKALGLPIILKGEAVGVLSVDRLFGDEVTLEEEMELLSLLAALVAEFVGLNRQAKGREDQLRKETVALIAQMHQDYRHLFVVGESPGMMQVQEQIEKVAPSDVPVLLLGESGTGRKLVARIIHELSRRAKCPFVEINCASPPEKLLESGFFVTGTGTLRGAMKDISGRLDEAEGTTLFLDEIGELSFALQSMLLKFLRDQESGPLTSAKTGKAHVRLIAATNKDLSEEVRRGQFREDLYYRVEVFPIRIPPLRERKEDIPLILNHFLKNYHHQHARRLRIAPQALDILVHYDWPGNVSEMINLMQRLIITVNGPRIEVKDLPMRSGGEMIDRDEQTSLSRLELMERNEIVTALARNNWFQSRTARELGLTFRQMNYRVKKFGLERVVLENRGGIACKSRKGV